MTAYNKTLFCVREDIDLLDSFLSSAEDEINGLNDLLKSKDDEIADLYNQIDQLQAQLDDK